MNPIIIKKVTVADIQQLQLIGKVTFTETFAEHNTAEDMQKYLEERFSTEQLISEVNNANSEFYFALINDDVVGYLKLNFGAAQTELKIKNSTEIERIYVLNKFHGKKVGQILFDTAYNIAKKNKSDCIWLGVWENNPKAIHFYEKNGFTEFDKHIFKLGNDEQTDIMMRLELVD